MYEDSRIMTLFDVLNPSSISTPTVRLSLNNVVVSPSNYTVVWPTPDIAVFDNLQFSLKTTDIFKVEVFSNSGMTTLLDQATIPIKFFYKYIEVSGDVTNGILPTDTTDKSANMNTPLIIRDCQEVNLNSHSLHIATVGIKGSSQSAAILINGNPAVASDFVDAVRPSYLPFTFNSSGVMTKDIGDKLNDSVTNPRTFPFTIETSRTRSDQGGLDTFVIDGIGFSKLSHVQPDWIDASGNRTDFNANIGDTFKVEVTNSEYRVLHNDILIYSTPKRVTYTSNIGTIPNANNINLGTEVSYTPTVYGDGYINAKFNTSDALQLVRNIITRKPTFSNLPIGGLTNTCPVETVNLGTLIDTNLTSGDGIVLEFHTSDVPTNATKLTNLNVGQGTYYAVQKQLSNSCYGLTTLVTVNITSCCTNITTGTLQGPDELTDGVSGVFSITGLNGTSPYTYLWSVVNGEIIGSPNHETAVISPTSHPMTVQVIVNNCNGSGNITRNKIVNVKLNCEKTITMDLTCKIDNLISVNVTLQGVTETNRVINFTQNSVTFKTNVGQHNYKMVLQGEEENETLEIVFKNILCE